MVDPLSVSVLGAAALTEGIKFIYAQATAILEARRERKRQLGEGAQVPERVNVPIRLSGALDRVPAGSAVDGDLLQREGKTLSTLTGVLAPYALGFEDVDPGDRNLLEQLERARALLEALYGERLTFAGERREPTGSRVDVKQVLCVVRGQAMGLDLEQAAAGWDIQVEQHVQEADSAVGARIRNLGGR